MLSETCAPLVCVRLSGVVRLIPLPEICPPDACARASGAASVMVAPPRALIEETTAVSEFAPSSIEIF